MCNSMVELTMQLWRGVAETGGATITTTMCEHGDASLVIQCGARPEGGYAVAVTSSGIAAMPHSKWNPLNAAIAMRMIRDSAELQEFLLGDPFAGLGIWLDKDTDMLQLDAVQIYDDLTVALSIAASRGQKAIYDLALGGDIYV